LKSYFKGKKKKRRIHWNKKMFKIPLNSNFSYLKVNLKIESKKKRGRIYTPVSPPLPPEMLCLVYLLLFLQTLGKDHIIDVLSPMPVIPEYPTI